MTPERSSASPSGARLFVALDLPEEVVSALLAWRAPLLREHDALRPVPRESLHVTLCFLGWLAEDAVAPLSDAVAEVAVATAAGPSVPHLAAPADVAPRPQAARAAPSLALGDPLWLPRRRPHALALGVRDRAGALGRLQAALAARLATGGWYAAEGRPYLPHVTVARVRGRGPAPRGAVLPEPPEFAFAGVGVTLFRSRLHPSGARYEPLYRHAFA